MNQYLIDYSVRNITTGNEEEIRLLELADDEAAGLPDDVRAILDPHRQAFQTHARIEHPAWDNAQDAILALLLPRIRNRALYESDYDAWQEWLLESDDADQDNDA